MVPQAMKLSASRRRDNLSYIACRTLRLTVLHPNAPANLNGWRFQNEPRVNSSLLYYSASRC
jgi:hypothetical protein